MEHSILVVEGMTCGHCAKTVQKALEALPGSIKVEVDLSLKRAVIAHEGSLDLAGAIQAVTAEGYKAHLLDQMD